MRDARLRQMLLGEAHDIPNQRGSKKMTLTFHGVNQPDVSLTFGTSDGILETMYRRILALESVIGQLQHQLRNKSK